MKKFSEYIGAQFGNPNGLIGKLCCIIMNVINRKMYNRVLLNIKNDNYLKILDIGYGNGYLIKKLHKKTNAEIYGIDISEDMLKLATKRNLKKVNEKKIILTVGDCSKLEFEDNKFDIITTINTIYFWENTLNSLVEIKRVLKDRGEFLNVVYSKKWLEKLSYTKTGFKFFEKEDYIKLGKEAGFSDVYIEEIDKNKSYLIKYIN